MVLLQFVYVYNPTHVKGSLRGKSVYAVVCETFLFREHTHHGMRSECEGF